MTIQEKIELKKLMKKAIFMAAVETVRFFRRLFRTIFAPGLLMALAVWFSFITKDEFGIMDGMPILIAGLLSGAWIISNVQHYFFKKSWANTLLFGVHDDGM